MITRAVLFDVGGPLNTEITHERLVDEHIRGALLTHGLSVTDEEYAAASKWAVDTYVSDVHPAILWRLSNGDETMCAQIHRELRNAVHARNVFELRDGILQVLAKIQARGLQLGLAANQPESTLERLDAAGIGHFFDHRQVSGTHGFHKPDQRLFLAACEDLGVAPNECIMVGDRVDNDIAPAKALGMGTILFRTGRHVHQMPRSWLEKPDAEVLTVEELEASLERLVWGALGEASTRTTP